MSRRELSKARRDFIKNRRRILSGSVDKLQEQLLTILIDNFWSKFEVSDGRILSNGKNISIATALDKIYDDFNRTENLVVVQSFASDLIKVQALNQAYFKPFEADKSVFERVNRKVLRLTRKELGLETSGQLSKNGFLEKFINDERLRTEIKNTTFQAISSGQSHDQFRKVLSDIIVGNENYAGGLQRHYRTFAYDTYQRVDRTNQVLFSKELNLKAFIYAGTVIANTRKFCKTKVGKVFLLEEAEKWQSQKFQGKNRDYNPITDLGGYNCLHQPDFISNQEAARRRKDLQVNERGELVKV